MRNPAPHQRILDLLRSIGPVEAQNRLLRTSDKEIALAMIYMSDWQQDFLLSFLGGAKGFRIRQELTRYEHTRVLYRQYELASQTVARALEGIRTRGARAYFRPLRSRSS